MKLIKRNIVLFTLLFISSTTAYSQYWNTALTSDIYYLGRVGIGTQTPVSELDVTGTTIIRHTAPEGIKFKYLGASTNGWQTIGSNANGDLILSSNSTIAGNENLVIKHDGNIGIGTLDPFAKLDVNGNIKTDGLEVANNSPWFFYNYDATTLVETTMLRLGKKYNASGEVFQLNVNDSGNKTFLTFSGRRNEAEYNWETKGFKMMSIYGVNNQGYRFQLFDQTDQEVKVQFRTSGESYLMGGNFGIGTTSPDEKLTVKGSIHAEEVKIEIIPESGPDYVFKEDYPLASLEEIKAYITENKHLPEVPSAKEMEANGVELGEMNMLLLKKIEELTLLLIQQEERIKSLEAKSTE